MDFIRSITNVIHHNLFCFSYSSLYEPECPDGDPRFHFSHESRLINCLLTRYDHVTTLARPVRNSSRHVRVNFGISLIQILDFDEIKQIITTSMWKTYVSILIIVRWKTPFSLLNIFHIPIRSAFYETKLQIGTYITGLILGLRPAYERRCHNVTPSLIDWVQT